MLNKMEAKEANSQIDTIGTRILRTKYSKYTPI